MRELVYYVSVSLDGYIAGPEGPFDAFDAEGDHMSEVLGPYADALPRAAAEHLGIEQPGTRFSSVVMGANTRSGGGVLAAQLREEIDRLVLKRQPVLFGGGVPLFAPGPYAPAPMRAVRATPYDSGVVLEEYARV